LGEINNQQQPTKMKKEHPILFSTPMVQAILAERKTQTRRVIKNIEPESKYLGTGIKGKCWLEPKNFGKPKSEQTVSVIDQSPYGKIGDLLWVRETFAMVSWPTVILPHYKADQADDIWVDKWKPSIHMPKAAARIWLEITDVRVERLHDISEDDAIAEGIETSIVKSELFQTYLGYKNYCPQDLEDNRWHRSPLESYRSLWSKINGVESLNANPWVWVVEFKVVSKNGRPTA
jgi:hypothetical protein